MYSNRLSNSNRRQDLRGVSLKLLGHVVQLYKLQLMAYLIILACITQSMFY